MASIFDSHESGARALVRTGRHGRTCIEWSEPFETTLYLQKDRKGEVCVVALENPSDFAEFDPRYNRETETLLTIEDYALEILELPLRRKMP